MSSFAGKTPIASSIHSDRAIPPARSNTETSYPDYAPPSYEAVTAISAPSTVSRPESFAVIEDEEPCTEPMYVFTHALLLIKTNNSYLMSVANGMPNQPHSVTRLTQCHLASVGIPY
jgi:hypothetical protein